MEHKRGKWDAVVSEQGEDLRKMFSVPSGE